MSLQVLWTPIALQSLSEVFVYTYTEFGERQLRKLSSQIYKVTRRIASFPQMGKFEEVLLKATVIDYLFIFFIIYFSIYDTIFDVYVFIDFV